MSYKPSDFFVGVIELFGILLPGATLSFLLGSYASKVLNGNILPKVSGAWETGVLFVVASYILGETLDAVGSLFDQVTDLYKDRMLKKKKHKKLMSAVDEVRRKMLGENQHMTSAFRWARTYVALTSPEGSGAIQRLEAEAKFFRSLTVLLLIVAIKFLVARMIWLGILAIALAAGALYRTAVERWQRNKTSYEFLVAESIRELNVGTRNP